MSYKAYIITNLVNGKKYVGITKNTIAARWAQHIHCSKSISRASKLHRAIAKYGAAHFAITHVASARTADELRHLEILLISQEQTFWTSGAGYNLTAGGEGPRGMIVTAETRAKLALAGKGRVASPETREKLRAHFKGRVIPEEQREKLRIAATGRIKSPELRHIHAEIFRNLTPEQREKGYAKLRGRKLGPEQVEKTAASHRGRKRPLETKLKLAEANRARQPQMWLWSPREDEKYFDVSRGGR